MLTVPEAARRAAPTGIAETIRRWIREGKLPARKIGTQHILEEEDLEAVLQRGAETLPLPPSWKKTFWGGQMPDWTSIVREQRSAALSRPAARHRRERRRLHGIDTPRCRRTSPAFELVAPPLNFPSERTSALSAAISAEGRSRTTAADDLFERLEAMSVRVIDDGTVHRREAFGSCKVTRLGQDIRCGIRRPGSSRGVRPADN